MWHLRSGPLPDRGRVHRARDTGPTVLGDPLHPLDPRDPLQKFTSEGPNVLVLEILTPRPGRTLLLRCSFVKIGATLGPERRDQCSFRSPFVAYRHLWTRRGPAGVPRSRSSLDETLGSKTG